jgi:hypothetical protein
MFDTPLPLCADIGVVGLRYRELHTGESLDWIWRGYLAPGNLTLLTGQSKTAGKTTLLSVLLAKMKEGGMLAGRPVRAGHVVVLSEESNALWFERGSRFDYAGHVVWFCRPFRGKPRGEQFRALVDHIRALHARSGVQLLVIDTLAKFLPAATENSADGMVAFLSELQHLADAGIAVLIIHHPGRRRAVAGQAARGSSALTGHVDIIMELRPLQRSARNDRRRRLRAWSRHDDTPASVCIEFNADRTDYVVAQVEADSVPLNDDLSMGLREVLMQATLRLTRQQIHESWPKGLPRPNLMKLWRMLDDAVRGKQIARAGAGTPTDPHRFWIPEREAQLRADPIMRSILEANGFLPRDEDEYGNKVSRQSVNPPS